MRNIILSCFIAIFLLSGCNNDSKKESNNEGVFVITGKVNFKTDKLLVLQQISGNNVITLDSFDLKDNNEFSFKGKLAEPGFYRIQLKNIANYVFALDTVPLQINIDGSAELPVFKTSGSKLNDDFEKIYAIQLKAQGTFDSLNRAFILAENMKDVAKIKLLEKEYQLAKERIKSEVKSAISTLDNNIVIVYAATFLDPKEDLLFLDSLATRLAPLAGTSKLIDDYINDISKVKNSQAGSFAPNFTGNTPDGRKVSLSDFKGKVVLLDFWASWCAPCRRENPNVVKLYNRFQGQDFAILGVSLDTDLNKWKDAINNDKLTWDQVSDLKGWESDFAVLYNVEEIPQTFLIDKTGKIAGKNLHGKELEDKILELLKMNI